MTDIESTESSGMSRERDAFSEIDILADQTTAGRQLRSTVREGLPPTYRMRADAHYVDQLSARLPSAGQHLLEIRVIDVPPDAGQTETGALAESIRTHGVLQPLLVRKVEGRYRVIDGTRRLSASIAAGLQHVPCVVHDVDDAHAAALAEAANIREAPPSPARPAVDWVLACGGDLAASLASLTSCSAMLSQQLSPFSRDAAATIIEAEVARASSLLALARVMHDDVPTRQSVLGVQRLLDGAQDHVRAEALLQNVQIEQQIDAPPDTRITGDEPLLVAAVAGLLRTTMGLVARVPGARATVAAAGERAGRLSVSVWQNAAAVPEVWFDRAFDPTWTDRPGGRAALTAMVAARKVAELHNGTASAAATGRGTRITLSLPTSA